MGKSSACACDYARLEEPLVRDRHAALADARVVAQHEHRLEPLGCGGDGGWRGWCRGEVRNCESRGREERGRGDPGRIGRKTEGRRNELRAGNEKRNRRRERIQIQLFQTSPLRRLDVGSYQHLVR